MSVAFAVSKAVFNTSWDHFTYLMIVTITTLSTVRYAHHKRTSLCWFIFTTSSRLLKNTTANWS